MMLQLILKLQTKKKNCYTDHRPAETNPCKVTIPIRIFWRLITGKNCTGDGGDSIFCMASTAIASGPIVLGLLLRKKDKRGKQLPSHCTNK